MKFKLKRRPRWDEGIEIEMDIVFPFFFKFDVDSEIGPTFQHLHRVTADGRVDEIVTKHDGDKLVGFEWNQEQISIADHAIKLSEYATRYQRIEAKEFYDAAKLIEIVVGQVATPGGV